MALMLAPAVEAIAKDATGAPSAPIASRQRVSSTYRVTVHPANMPPLQLYVEEMGQGPILLLLHGLGGSSYTWREIAPALAARHRVMAIDMRGFGRSDKPMDRSYSPFDHAAVVKAFIAERRLAGVTLIGHSYGGVVALLLAMDRRIEQHRIARLVLIDTPAYRQDASAGVRFLRSPILPYIAMHLLPPDVPIGIALMMENVGPDKITSRDIATYADPLREHGGPHALIETARQIEPSNFDRIAERYRTIAKPTLVLTCRDDQVVPLSTATRLVRTIPHARLAVLDGCDHIPAEQAPAAVLKALRPFLAN